jgi:hypothetical protein
MIYSVLNFNHNIIFLVEYFVQTFFGLNCTTILDLAIVFKSFLDQRNKKKLLRK